MNEMTTYYRNKIAHGLYKSILKPVFFRNDPESVHDVMVKMGNIIGRNKVSKKLIESLFDYQHPTLNQNILDMTFKNPIGLSAGFDKNAELTDILPFVGFGFAEVGSITGNCCEGNPKPRLWRLPRSKSVAVYYGLKNDGCEVIEQRLRDKSFLIPIGVSVAMTNCQDNVVILNAINDYAKAFKTMKNIATYITINISCPNAFGGQPFVVPHKLDYLLDVLDEIPTKKPIFIKLSPDLTESELDGVLTVISKHRVNGVICTNLTKNRDNPNIIDKDIPEKGGISGKVVQELSDNMVKYIYRKAGKRFVIIGSGGVFTAEDAYRKIRLGASLVQIITGMIFEGPQVVSQINQGLAKLLNRDGFKSISEAVGADNRL